MRRWRCYPSHVSPDEKVLIEAERWFRALLRGSGVQLRPHECALFTAIAERQNALGNIYVAKDFTAPARPLIPIPEKPEAPVTTTLRPSPTKMRGLIERSKKPTGVKK